MIITFHRDFTKRFKALPQKIQVTFKERLIIFEDDQFNPILNNHSLRGKYKGYRSINVTGDIRAIYKQSLPAGVGKSNDNIILFTTIGSHSNLYS